MTSTVAVETVAQVRRGSHSMRRRRAVAVMDMIRQIHSERGECRILDLGGTASYWSIFERGFLHEHGVQITLLNLEAEQVRPDPLFHSLAGDACATEMPDNSFDLVHSNSVVEHVGDWPRMEAFAAEVRRLAPAYFVQTPYFWFFYEPHMRLPLFQWLPEQLRAVILLKRGGHGDYGLAMRRVQSARLLDRRQFAHLFPDASFSDEKFYGLTKSLMAARRAG